MSRTSLLIVAASVAVLVACTAGHQPARPATPAPTSTALAGVWTILYGLEFGPARGAGQSYVTCGLAGTETTREVLIQPDQAAHPTPTGRFDSGQPCPEGPPPLPIGN